MIDLAVDGLFGCGTTRCGLGGSSGRGSAPLTDRALDAAALAIRAFGAALAGLGAEAQRYREEAAELIDELSDEELARRLDALAHLATADFYLDHFEASGSHAERALTIGRATGQGELFPLIGSMLGGSFWVRGQMADAGEVLDGALEAARLVDNIQGRSGTSSIARSQRSPPEISSLRSHLPRRVSSWRNNSTTARSQPTQRWPSQLRLLETGRTRRDAELLLAKAGGDELRLIGGGWQGPVPRAAHPLLSGGGQPPGSRARRGGGAGLRR